MPMLVEALKERTEPLRIRCADKKEAMGRRSQVQMYFRALELYTEDLARAAERLRFRAENGKKPEVVQEAKTATGVLEVWEGRMVIARQWMVRLFETPTGEVGIELARRTVTGVFGDSLKAILAEPRQEAAKPSADFLQDQFALLRQATLALERTGGRPDDETV